MIPQTMMAMEGGGPSRPGPWTILLTRHRLDRPFLLKFLAGLALAALVVLDRAAWASIAQWREDQAASVWIGYVQPIQHIPVGLINSQGLPNPNGMILLGYFLSRLPGLLAISTSLGIIQSLLLSWFCWSWFGKSRLFLLTGAVLLSSALLRAISIEFWNQWILLYLNLLFFIILRRYLQRPSVRAFPLVLLVVLLAPSLYLGGIANALSFLILFAILFLESRSRLDRRGLLPAILISAAMIAALLALTWIPYLRALMASNWASYLPASPHLILRSIGISLITLIGFIGWNITWILRLVPSVMFFDGNMLPPSAGILINLHNFILEYLSFISLIGLSFACLTSYRRNKNFKEVFLPGFQVQGKLIALAYGFILFSFMITPLLKGPFWINGERMDMTLQFLPFFLVIWFVTPTAVQLPPIFQALIKRIAGALGIVFVAVNLALGWMTVESVRNYRGDVLTRADVPLFQKLQAVQSVAQDWASKSTSRVVPIYYDFSAVIPPESKDTYGTELNPWYPAPYTLGRAFDYELLRNYGLWNSQEGLPSSDRKKENEVYIIHYSFLPAANPPGCYQERTIERLSVAVLQSDPASCPGK